jgi:hypothetical protein
MINSLYSSYRRIVLTLALVLAAIMGAPVLLGAAIAEGSTASAAPVIYSCGMGPHWGCPTVKPSNPTFGAHYGVGNMHWSLWSKTAHGTGHYYAGYNPANGRPISSYNATVTAYGILTHTGRRYFDKLKITASGHRTQWLHVGSSGLWVTSP